MEELPGRAVERVRAVRVRAVRAVAQVVPVREQPERGPLRIPAREESAVLAALVPVRGHWPPTRLRLDLEVSLHLLPSAN